ncbi:MAG: tRNA (cytidine(34)-2'-O)-methyltransferase [Planctomycetes bacterium]|nr:tRNA (cytidine(34)-2'-O)-methyltransferase [Planctomycetota bacterium]
MDVVLVHPEIPHNSGCAARLCAATGATLHLVRPLGFTLEDRYLKRAGLDYWPDVDMVVHDDWSALETGLGRNANTPFAERLRLFSARGGTSLFDTPFARDDILVFGSETKGLPASVFAEEARGARRVYIPIRDCVRSLNLANVVCLALYTAMHRAGVPMPDNDGNYVAKERALKVRPGEIARPSHPPENGSL